MKKQFFVDWHNVGVCAFNKKYEAIRFISRNLELSKKARIEDFHLIKGRSLRLKPIGVPIRVKI